MKDQIEIITNIEQINGIVREKICPNCGLNTMKALIGGHPVGAYDGVELDPSKIQWYRWYTCTNIDCPIYMYKIPQNLVNQVEQQMEHGK